MPPLWPNKSLVPTHKQTRKTHTQVRDWITQMKARGDAFYSEASRTYMLAGVLFERVPPADYAAHAASGGGGGGAVSVGVGPDLTDELLRVLKAL